ncbi:MAG TPA: HAMP domain-containing histidine kinase [Candidatus Eisenbergiella stercoravium]|nr:HAMP domain-containing histidine kinase [Candidatus Eisenbergiella stercoravium]
MKKDIHAIATDFHEKLKSDTNTLLTLSGNDESIRALAADINKALKELRRQRLRFEQGDAELKNAITSISHDLRTPLTAISGYLDLLEREETSNEAGRYIGIIANRIEVLKQLANELFKYSVITSPDYNLTMEWVSLNAVLEESVAGYYAALQKKGIVPEISMPPTAVYRTVNRAALSRTFSNLIGNAIKYSNGDLNITLKETGEIVFSNTAPELSEVQVERLFDRFYTVQTAGKSTGLGLSISRILTEQMNGRITADFHNGKLSISIQFSDKI